MIYLFKINITLTIIYLTCGFFTSRGKGLNNIPDWVGGLTGLALVILWPLYLILLVWI